MARSMTDKRVENQGERYRAKNTKDKRSDFWCTYWSTVLEQQCWSKHLLWSGTLATVPYFCLHVGSAFVSASTKCADDARR